MESTALILLCAFALATASRGDVYPNGCPRDENVEQLLPHNNCHQFYQCWDGQLVEHTCPSNLYFSVEKNRCEWAEEVDCSGREIPDDNNDNDNSGDNGGGNGDNGDGNNGNGDNGNGNGTCNCNPGEAPAICAADDSDGILVAHENCNQFYICNGGQPTAVSCPGNLMFNPYTNQCDWADNVECGDRVVPECDGEDNGNGDNGGSNGDGNGDNGSGDNGNGDNGNGNGTCNCNPGEAPAICAADGSDGILVAHENCNQFYICNGGQPTAVSCPGNLMFNPYTNQCDWADNVECGDRVIPECDGEDNGNGDNGGGNGDSGSGDNGNGDNGGGDNGGGDNGSGNGTCNCNPGEAPAICAADDSDGILVAHENCNQFYICNGGQPTAVSCPGNLMFNPYTNQCDWADNVECGDRVIPECDGEDNGNGDNGGGNGDSGSGDNGNGDNGGGDNGGGDNGSGNGTCNCNPGEAPAICAADDSDGILVAHENCNQFYICNGGQPTAVSCPGNLMFNPYTNQCDWADNVECGDRVIPECDGEDNGNGDNGGGNGDSGSGDNGNGDNGGGGNGSGNGTCNCNPGEAPAICAADESDGILVAHENCNQFYICNGGQPTAVSCPGNLMFNPYTNQCDWADNVECGDRVIPECDGEDNGNGDNGGGNGDSGSGDNGNGDNGGGDNGGGDNGSGNGTCNCNPGEAPAICAADDSDGILVAHENCNQFYICNGGQPTAVSCPGNLMFNPYTNQCDWADNVECGDRVIPECDGEDNGNGDNGGGNGDSGSGDNGNGDNGGGDNGSGNGTCNCNPGEAPAICAADESDGILVAHENCNQFYICNGGQPTAVSCPGNLMFNPYTNQCDWADNVECGDRVIPECDGEDNGNGDNGGGNGDSGSGDNGNGDNGGGDNGGGDNGSGNGTCNCNPGEAPAICAADESDGILVAHENCNQFYICNGGQPTAVSCPGNLMFNPYTNQCDWADNVECGDRVIPECDGEDNGNGDNGGCNGDSGSGDNGNGDNGGGDNGSGNGTCNCNPGEAPAICAADESDGILVAHENCNQFYICNGGQPTAVSCPGNLMFNPYTNQCDWADNVECGDRVIPECDGEDNGNGDNGGGNGDSGSGDNGNGDNGGGDNGGGDNGSGNGTCNCNPGEAPAICAADDSDGILVAHENCNQFYICNGGQPTAVSCPGNLMFNPYTNQCDWADNVECGDRVIPDCDSEENGNGDNGGGSGDGNGDGNGDNGSGDNGNGDNGNGDNGSGNGTCNCNPGEAPAICATDESDGILVAHENCNQFYICNGRQPTAVSCPGNLLFNPYTNQCDWADNVECGDRVIPECDGEDNGNGDNGGGNGDSGSGDNDNGDNGGGDNGGGDNGSGNGTCNCNPGEAPAICAADDSDGILVAHENCNQFYICNGGQPTAVSCPGDLLFNPYTNQCDWANDVDCGDRVIPECDGEDNGNGDNGGGNGDNGSGDNGNGDNGNGDSGNGDSGSGNGTCNCNPGEAPAICAADESDGILVAHENCNQFYICNGGQPTAVSCPGNLLFNPYTNQCDWADNVECGDRVIPDCDGEDNGNGDNGGGNGDSGSGDNGNGDNGGGDNGSGNGTCNCNPGEAPAICAADDSEGVFVAHENCNQFYVCNGGRPVVLSCPGNLLFNPYANECDWPENVNCDDRVIPDGECDNNENGDSGNEDGDNGGGTCNCNPEEAPALCAAEDSDGVLVAHEQCNYFYICNGGVPVAQRCPESLLFNPYTNQCDWAENVNCSGGNENNDADSDDTHEETDNNELSCLESNGGAGNDDPQQASAICSSQDSSGVLIAHENCNQYYICDHGRPVAVSCPASLLFNPYNDKCDWSHCVACGNRVHDVHAASFTSLNKHLSARQVRKVLV